MSGVTEIHFNQHPEQHLHRSSSRTVPREPEHGANRDSRILHCPLRVCGDALGLQTPPGSTSEGWDPWITAALTPHGSLQAPHCS